MQYIEQLAFALLLVLSLGFFARTFYKIIRNIGLGRSEPMDRSLGTMLRVALGQQKMVVRPIPAALHLCVYLGFLIINIEIVEIILDGLLGTQRILGGLLGPVYSLVTAGAEVFFLLALLATVIFLLRRNVLKLRRFSGTEMSSWPRLDANIILWTEIVLILALVVMNASYQAYHQKAGEELYGSYPLTHVLVPAFMGFEVSSLHLIERLAWWLHIVGILLFLNYIPCSKHFHIMMAFPNTYFTRQRPKGYFPLNAQVKQEVALMLDPGATAPAAPAEPQTFGAKDIFDLSRKNLMDAYTCTECGRCTSECPANLTGKKLSPRKIMMDTRDRMEEVGAQLDKQKKWQYDGKTLHDRISAEELWACTSCNACVQACPVNINPLDIILKMRQYLVMEQSQAPEALMAMFTNIENNGAPWPMSASDRFNWAQTGA